MKISKKIEKGYILTPEEIDAEVEEMLKIIKSNEFPRMAMKCNGVPRKLATVSEKELKKSAEIIYER